MYNPFFVCERAEKLWGNRAFAQAYLSLRCLLTIISSKQQKTTKNFDIILFLITGKYAQITNNPENDGCINAVLLV